MYGKLLGKCKNFEDFEIKSSKSEQTLSLFLNQKKIYFIWNKMTLI